MSRSIASGGAGAREHFAPAVAAGADAVLAASVFHFGDLTVAEVKDDLRAAASSSAGPVTRVEPAAEAGQGAPSTMRTCRATVSRVTAGARLPATGCAARTRSR